MDLGKSILIIDDEDNIRRYLSQALVKEGFEVFTAEYGKEGLDLLIRKHIDIVLLDLNLPDVNGLNILREMKRIDVESMIIIITAYGDIVSAVEAMKLGAYDFLTKPFEVEDIMMVVHKALKLIGLENRIQLLERQMDRSQYGELVTRSKNMNELLEYVNLVANTSATIMLHGETGTGKELIAKLIHQQSARANGPFVTIDCTSIPENLLESELFGHEKGAFTGAIVRKKGLFEVAHMGTVFLDEIGELPLALQSKILRVLETNQFRRVGSDKYMHSDVRVVAATNRDLKKLIEQDRFRSDLYYRLNVVPINLPSLRERKEDVFPLIEYFVQIFNKKIGRSITEVSNEALRLMIDYDWPGNIRELKNVIEHMVIICDGEVILVNHLPSEIKGVSPAFQIGIDGSIEGHSEKMPDFHEAKKELLERFERDYLTILLGKNNWNVSSSAREIDMHRSSLQRLIRKYGIKKPAGMG